MSIRDASMASSWFAACARIIHARSRAIPASEHQDGGVASTAHQAKIEHHYGHATGALCGTRPIQARGIEQIEVAEPFSRARGFSCYHRRMIPEVSSAGATLAVRPELPACPNAPR